MSLNPLVDSRDVRFVLFEMLELEKMNRFDQFKTQEATAEAKKKVLSARQKTLQAARDKLSAMLAVFESVPSTRIWSGAVRPARSRSAQDSSARWPTRSTACTFSVPRAAATSIRRTESTSCAAFTAMRRPPASLPLRRPKARWPA